MRHVEKPGPKKWQAVYAETMTSVCVKVIAKAQCQSVVKLIHDYH